MTKFRCILEHEVLNETNGKVEQVKYAVGDVMLRNPDETSLAYWEEVTD